MLASTKAMTSRISESDGFATALDALRLARYAMHNQLQRPLAAAQSVLPRPLATPIREAGRIGLLMGDAVEHLVEETVLSLREALQMEESRSLSPLDANIFDQILSSRRRDRQKLAGPYIRYLQQNARQVMESFGIRNYLLMESALRDSFTGLCQWRDVRENHDPQDRVERIFACAAACFTELVYAAPLKLMEAAKFDIPILSDRALQTHINPLVFGYLCYLSALGSLKHQLQAYPPAFYYETARNDVIGEFTSLLSAVCQPDPQTAVADFFIRRFHQSPISVRRQLSL